jgi:hypothetical protein
MQRRTRFKIALVLAVPLCLALAWVGHAAWTDTPTKLEIAKYIKNAWGLVSLPIWQINITGHRRSVEWVDWAGNPRFALWDPHDPPTPADPSDDVVIDKTTGLVWTRNVDIAGQTMTWRSAREFCFGLTVGNLHGFRLPSLPEIYTLCVPGGSPPGTQGLFVNHIGVEGWWTSTRAHCGDPAAGCKGPDPLDEGQAELDSLDAWNYASCQSGAINSDWLNAPAGTGPPWHTVTWRPGIDEAGIYDVYAFVPKCHAIPCPNATNAPYTINYDGGPDTVNVDQTVNDGKWHLLGTYPFAAGTSGYVQLSDNADGIVVADAVRFIRHGELLSHHPHGREYAYVKNNWYDDGDTTNHGDEIYELRSVWAVRGGGDDGSTSVMPDFPDWKG